MGLSPGAGHYPLPHLLPPLAPRTRHPLTLSRSYRLAQERDALQQDCNGLRQELREATECREVGAA